MRCDASDGRRRHGHSGAARQRSACVKSFPPTCTSHPGQMVGKRQRKRERMTNKGGTHEQKQPALVQHCGRQQARRGEARRRERKQQSRSHDGALWLSTSTVDPILQTDVGQLAVAATEELTALHLATALAGPLRCRRKEGAHASADRGWLRRCRRAGRGAGGTECSGRVEQRMRVRAATRGARNGVGLIVHGACRGGGETENSQIKERHATARKRMDKSKSTDPTLLNSGERACALMVDTDIAGSSTVPPWPRAGPG